ncbi:hypothetical protein CERSUDRAFT_159603 [Gelatoporia subvermispora B]|uniref:Uncharacterized protein n=1 Tax=Ceriporiopsis subvermispora (strain B) TaxID=914234 RepID=M2PE52_CERS8|nr:hypothetical protein CERSUDRAFT_159603 [Gelatoporia subvermispora B]
MHSYPPELLSAICARIYDAALPPPVPSLDPLLNSDGSIPTSLPSSYPPAHWTDALARRTLANLCLVNRAWYEAAKPWLWRKVEVRLPRSWLTLVDQIVGDEEQLDDEQAARIVDQSIQEATNAVLAIKTSFGQPSDKAAASELHSKLVENLSGPDGSIPPELLSPPASRDPSPRRLRTKSKSPARWKLMRSISAAVQNVMNSDGPGLYVPTPYDPRPGHLIRHLDFNHFRTIGMRRSVEEGVNNRFVTGGRLETILKEMPNLVAFGATEYMDGALTLPVLKELLLRGSASRSPGRPSRGRGLVVVDPNDAEEDDRERRRESRELEALDMTGCVSAVFVNALTQFVTTHLIGRSDDDTSDGEGERGRYNARSAPVDEPLTFPGVQRLGLRGVKSVQPSILNPFLLAFPSLTHLDLSCTRITPDLLASLSRSTTIRLRSLALERCNWLTSESIRDFLIYAPAAQDIRELSLYGDGTFPSPLTENDLQEILSRAPCFQSGELVYLDISSAPVTKAHLLEVAVAQPRLRSLGLSHIPNLDLQVVAEFLRTKAPNVEILTLVMTASQLGYGTGGVSLRQASVNLHAQFISLLCRRPFIFRLTPSADALPEPPTRLRVIELAPPLLATLGSGAGSWKHVKSKGGRGWYVDVASGWIADSTPGATEGGDPVLRRDLEPENPWRAALESLADANGNVSSGVGWHARKMEILHGHGLLGREAGLYGAVAFAYQG